jgi:hypothetical protein
MRTAHTLTSAPAAIVRSAHVRAPQTAGLCRGAAELPHGERPEFAVPPSQVHRPGTGGRWHGRPATQRAAPGSTRTVAMAVHDHAGQFRRDAVVPVDLELQVRAEQVRQQATPFRSVDRGVTGRVAGERPDRLLEQGAGGLAVARSRATRSFMPATSPPRRPPADRAASRRPRRLSEYAPGRSGRAGTPRPCETGACAPGRVRAGRLAHSCNHPPALSADAGTRCRPVRR